MDPFPHIPAAWAEQAQDISMEIGASQHRLLDHIDRLTEARRSTPNLAEQVKFARAAIAQLEAETRLEVSAATGPAGTAKFTNDKQRADETARRLKDDAEYARLSTDLTRAERLQANHAVMIENLETELKAAQSILGGLQHRAAIVVAAGHAIAASNTLQAAILNLKSVSTGESRA